MAFSLGIKAEASGLMYDVRLCCRFGKSDCGTYRPTT